MEARLRIRAEVRCPRSRPYVAAGFSGHGFMHSPGTGQLIAEEMLDGRASTLDITDLSLERFRSCRRPFTPTVL